MRHEDAHQIPGVLVGNRAEARRNTRCRPRAGLHQGFSPLYGQAKLGHPPPTLGQQPETRIRGQHFPNRVESHVRAAADSAFDEFVPLQDVKSLAGSRRERLGDQIRSFPGAQQLRGFYSLIEFETQFLTELEYRLGSMSRLLAAFVTERK